MYGKHGKTKLITWFFAWLTMLFLALYLVLNVGFTVHAEQVNDQEGNPAYDTDDYINFVDKFNIDIQELLCSSGNDEYMIYPNTAQPNMVGYYFQDSNSFGYSDVLNYITNSNNSVFNVPSVFHVGQQTYNIDDYNNYGIFVSAGNYNYFTLVLTDGSFFTDGSFWYSTSECIKMVWAGVYTPTGVCYISTPTRNDNIDNNGSTVSGYLISNYYYDGIALSNTNCKSPKYIYDAVNQSLTVQPDGYELNYLLGDDGLGGGGSSGTDEQTSSNNCVMDEADWTFVRNEGYTTKEVYPRGSVSFTFAPNSYQLSHKDEFNVGFRFDFNLSCKYQWKKNSNPPFYKTSSLTNNWKEVNGYFVWYDSDTDEIYVEVPLTTFCSNGNTKSFTWNELFDGLKGYPNDIEKTLSGFLQLAQEADSTSYSNFLLSCTAYLVTTDSDYYSGNYIETYNVITKANNTTDASGKINPNPYVEPDQNPDDEDSGTTPPTPEDEESSTKTNGININITNNNTNNGGGSGNGVTTPTNDSEAALFYNTFNPVKLFTNKLFGDNNAYSSELANQMGATGWLTMINENFSSFAPFITLIITYFTISLGILIVAFIIRIILDLL